MIKICTIDLDGTLFDKEKNISKENIEAIKEARKNGCKIVVATGRPISGVTHVLEALELTTNDDYVICYNGAKVLNCGTKETVFELTITGSDVKKIYQYVKENNLNYHAFRNNGELICNRQNPYTDVECRINKVIAYDYDFDTVNDDDLFLKAMIVDDFDFLNNLTKGIDPYFYTTYTMVRSSRIFLEFLNKKVDKGLALENLAKYLNVSMDETMAIGDAENDLSMIKRAKIGVAMANAFPEVLAECDFVTLSNEESGVAYAINKFVNGK